MSNYYTVKKEELLSYFIQNSEPNGITPSSFIPPYFINRISSCISSMDHTLDNHIENDYQEWVNHSSSKQLSLKKQIQTFATQILLHLTHENKSLKTTEPDLDKILEKATIDFQIFNSLHKKSHQYLPTNIDVTLLKSIISDRTGVLNQKDLEFIENFEALLTNNYVNNSTIDLAVFSHYVTSIEQYETLMSIVNLSHNPKQTNILNIDFGTENLIPTDPIKNLLGLHELHASFYNPQIETIIFQSISDYNIIKSELSSVQILDNNSPKIQELLNSRNNYISLNTLFNPNAYINKDQDKKVFAEISIPDALYNKIQSSEKVPFAEFIPDFKATLSIYAKSPLSEKTSLNNKLEVIFSSFTQYEKNDVLNCYIEYVKELFADPTKENQYILSLLSPNTPNFGGTLINGPKDNTLHNLLENNLTLVETAYLYSRFFPTKNDGTLIYRAPQTTEYSIDYNEKKIFDQGSTINEKAFSILGKNAQNTFAKIIKQVTSEDPSIYLEFNKHEIFKKIQKDIYPALPFKNKLNFMNYECFINSSFDGNVFTHVTSLPISLFANKDLFKSLVQHLEGNSSQNTPSFYHDYYFPKAIATQLENEINNFYQASDIEGNNSIVSTYTIDNDFKFLNNFFKHRNSLFREIAKSIDMPVFLQFMVDYSKKHESNELFNNILGKKCLSFLEYTHKDLETSLLINFFEQFQLLKEVPSADKSNLNKILNNFANFQDFSGKNEQRTFLLNIYKYKPTVVTNDLTSSLQNFFSDVSVLSEIINFHKVTKTVSQSSGFNLSDGFKSPHFSSAIYSKAKFKKISELGLDLYHLHPSNILELPSEIFNSKDNWVNFFEENITEQSPQCQLKKNFFPQSLMNDVDLFNLVVDKTIEQIKFKTTSLKSSFLLLFNPLLFNQEQFLIKLITQCSDAYEQGKNDASFDKLEHFVNFSSHINTNLCSELSKCKNDSIRERTNQFQVVLDGLENMRMSQQIFDNQSTLKPSSIKKNKF